MLLFLISAIFVSNAHAGPSTEKYKDQFCTDPRTMKKHAAYSEWADAYSCTRHRCQPGGRSLAIYTVGCKRVEAPESAIECEEVVEDTNIQFPYCCTRLRCLVVVRGEVWTRVLGQPWEALPAAPWSHMYKMKKPPPSDTTFNKKNDGEGPIYELATTEPPLISGRKMYPSNMPDVVDENPRVRPPAQDSPDIVIALSTGNERSLEQTVRRQRTRKRAKSNAIVSGEDCEGPDCDDGLPIKPEKTKPRWAQVSPLQYENDEAMIETENAAKETFQEVVPEVPRTASAENKGEKPVHLQALVDAIGTRMRDIENVVQRMSDKVNTAKTAGEPIKQQEFSAEKKYSDRSVVIPQDAETFGEKKLNNGKRPGAEGDKYRRFNNRNRNKYLTTRTEAVTEVPLFMEDGNLNGYFSGSSNLLRRGIPPKEPSEPAIYMAPVIENRQPNPRERSRTSTDISDELENKTNHKRLHKKKKAVVHHKNHHHNRNEPKKSFNKINSIENMVASMDDNSSGAA